MGITLDWLGTATFRLTVDDLVLFLDAYMERVPSAPAVGLSCVEVTKAGFILVGHSHFDHLAGAEVIARRTGAPAGMGAVCTGDVGLTQDDRRALMAERSPFNDVFRGESEWARSVREHMRSSTGSVHDGGALVYLIETPYGRVFYQDSSGCWTGVLRDLRADVALLAAAGRPNVDGEPFQGSVAQFIATEASLVGARTVVLDHHDNWLGNPDYLPPDLEPLRRELARSGATLLEMDYLESVPLLA